eukprot:CAMPEP_0206463384 /NCGR_PEP_ID=MMETSP0324_2-20121206/26567_1 /ASSEMBLY_ACC=CAM_ASM_000836 /TAXON_ID=2866 /ORGANISM="Crypthecodinium cohnii, Strain Seligo" /LENGTH=370 /DNA_ID=CAMNT_0053935771 /DNA_START=77 /DNA_END=1189 /DNA_ORIENTATION=+
MAAQRAPACRSASLCVTGEALIDLLPRETVEGQKAWLPKVGGSPFNVCIAAQRLGLPVKFFGGLSNDMFGQELYKYLEKEGVDLSLVHKFDKPSTLAFVSKTPGQDVQYAFFKENTADRAINSDHATATLEGCSFGAVHMSLGAITLQDEHMKKTFTSLFETAHAKGSFTSFDPNIRDTMIEGSPAEYAKSVEDFIKLVDLAKSSDADIEYMYGKDTTLDEVAKRWLDIGARVVVVTRGPEGASAWYKSGDSVETFTVAPPCEPPCTMDAEGKAVPVGDTVGAGDTCMGGLLFGCLGGLNLSELSLTPQLASGEPWTVESATRLKEILREATTAAAINVSRYGCDPPTQQELKAALKAVEARKGPVEPVA